MGCIVEAIRTEADWQRVYPRIEEFLSRGKRDPWQNAEHCRSLHTIFWQEEVLWLVTLHEGPVPAAMILLKEESSERKFEKRILRSIDTMVLHTSSLWSAPEVGDAVVQMFFDARKAITRETHTDAVYLYRQSPGISRVYGSSSQIASVKQFTTGLCIDLEEGIDPWYDHVGKKQINDIHRRERKMSRDLKTIPTFRRRRGDLFADASFAEDWRQYEHMRRHSWQMLQLEETGYADISAVERYVRNMAGYWSSKGQLELVEMHIDGKLAAAHLNIIDGDTMWMYVMNHDPAFRSYGVGMQLLLWMITDSYENSQTKHWNLGGEANQWKSKWTNSSQDIYTVGIPLMTARSSVKRILKTFTSR